MDSPREDDDLKKDDSIKININDLFEISSESSFGDNDSLYELKSFENFKKKHNFDGESSGSEVII